MVAVSTFSGLNPGFTPINRVKLFNVRPAPTNRIIAIAISETTSTPAMPRPGPTVTRVPCDIQSRSMTPQPRALNRWHQPADNAGQQPESNRDAQHTTIDAQLIHARNPCGRHARQQIDHPGCQQDAGNTARKAQQRTFSVSNC